MAKGCLRIVVFMVATIVSCGLLLKVAGCTDSRELDSLQTRRMVKRTTGRDLPADTQGIRAIHIRSRALDSDVEYVFMAFSAGPESQAYMLKTFGGEHIREFPHEKNSLEDLDTAIFDVGCIYQNQMGVSLFDPHLLNRIGADIKHRIMTGDFPSDALQGYYLASDDTHGVAYRVLVLTDPNTVYMAIERREN